MPGAMAFPSIVLVLFLILLPVYFEAILSCSYRDAYTGAQNWIGLANFTHILKDHAFRFSLWNATLYALLTTCMQLMLGVVMAAHVHGSEGRLRQMLRTVLFLPYIVPAVSSVLAFDFLFDDRVGVLTLALAQLGMRPGFHSGGNIFILMVLVSVWQFTPFVFLIVLAKLETIPQAMLEVAEADGAGKEKVFFRILLPQLRSTLVATALLRLIFMFSKFDIPWLLMGSKGLNRYAETLPVYSYRLAFESASFGEAAACGMLLFSISACVATAGVRWFTES